MVFRRAIQAGGCNCCRLSLLRTFTSFPIRATQLPARVSACPISRRAPFSSTTRRRKEEDENRQVPVAEGSVVDVVAEEDGSRPAAAPEAGESEMSAVVEEEVELITMEEKVADESPAVPWYLQVAGPNKAPQFLSERQRIPELPSSPPPILEPLLKQISVDLGMDSLSILDLRKLDPPPALGANLLMLIGTARSEKHLHVSADRLCRWLRSNYKLRPNADGLLGRNELKLKLKRKAKRNKLMGNSTEDDADDGVRTGWVCVDVGIVESPAGQTEIEPAREAGFVGFGRRTDGIRIVVQMLTEEKREEMELESLWNGILKRSLLPRVDEIEGDLAEESFIESAGHSSLPIRKIASGPILAQSRGFHTLRANRAEAAGTDLCGEAFAPSVATHPDLPSYAFFRESLVSSLNCGNYTKAHNDFALLRQSPAFGKENGTELFYELLRTHIKSLPASEASKHLGTDSSTRSDTPFLTCFAQSISTFDPEEQWKAKIWLLCLGRRVSPAAYNLAMFKAHLHTIELLGVKISPEDYYRIITCILRPQPVAANSPMPSRPSNDALRCAMNYLQSMHERGIEVLSADVFVTLQEATESHKALDFAGSKVPVYGLPSIPMPPLGFRIHRLMTSVNLPVVSDEACMRLMTVYARQQYWGPFWDIWGMQPRQGKAHSEQLLAFMFGKIAETKHQHACMLVLRQWVPKAPLSWDNRDLTGALSESIKACLLIAQPHVERKAADHAKEEWAVLWKRCG